MFEFNQGELISVVVPAYGHEKYILNALDSVYSQTYQNIELIVLDDKSKDKSFELAKHWASQAKVKARFSHLAIEQNATNQGAHNTINMAMSKAKGKLIAILNSDDAYHPQRLELMSTEMVKHGTGFAFSKVSPMDEDGNFASTYHLPIGIEDVFEYADKVAEAMPAISFGFLQRNIAISTGNFLIHKDLLDEIGGFRPLLYVHDWDFVLKVICVCEPAYISMPLYQYRIHELNSFKTLGHLGRLENELILSDFVNRINRGDLRNKSVPSSSTWPNLYEMMKRYLSIINVVPSS